ncbi:MAG: zinc ribbon domain-containing protein [Anaerolineales bacterium]|nr:zinc ribbon domain-containing protein [Anaerolineales bacterium]MCX7609320.1 zinc ribbon domain-containing protein [Anaerolineales bacterium]MDW8226391.1 zinc ribbon domain-containing protein [Anaerolineales bacterium]
MNRYLLILLLFLVALHPFLSFSASAQETPRLARAYVQIWPEFDRPEVLVILSLTLPEQTKLPATVEFRIPAQAEIHAVAVADPTEGLLYAEYQKTLEGTWTRLRITATTLNVHIEYYDTLIREGNQRTVTYRWPGGFQVDEFVLAFQLPLSASNLVMTPSPARSEVDAHNFQIYFTAPISLQPEQDFRFSARYQKPDDALSVSLLQVEPEKPLTETSGRWVWSDVLPWVVGILGVGLIGLGILVGLSFWRPEWFSKRPMSVRMKQNRRPRPAAKDQTVVYCHACGRRAQPGDRFCRACGEQLRTGD